MYLSPPVSSQESSTDLSSDHVVKQVSKQDPTAVEMAQTPIFYEEELASLEQNLKPPLSSSFGATPSPKKVVADQPSFSLIEKSAFWPLDTTAYPRNEVANQPGFLSEESAALGPILPNASLNPTCTQSSAAKPGNEPANHPGFSLEESASLGPTCTQSSAANPGNEVANQPGFSLEESAALKPILPNTPLNPTCTQSSAAKPGNEVANQPDSSSEESAVFGSVLSNALLDPTCTQSSAPKPVNEVANKPKFSPDEPIPLSQVFPKAPLLSAEQQTKGGAVLDSCSRLSRQKRALEKAQSSPDQTRLVDFFSILDEVESLCLKNEKLTSLLKQSNSCFNYDLYNPILRQTVCNAEKNAGNSKHGYRHTEIVKKFAIALFIYSGPLAYDFLQHNLSQALPSWRTVRRLVYSEYKTITEGEFRFDELETYLNKHNAPKVISLGEDATRVVSRVEYDSETDRCVGFVLPSNKNGTLQVNSFLAVSFEAIEKMFATTTIAKYAYVYMVKPLGTYDVPAFCLSCFGTDNKFTTEQVVLSGSTS